MPRESDNNGISLLFIIDMLACIVPFMTYSLPLLLSYSLWVMSKQNLQCTTLGVFTWTRITFRKTFRNAIQNVIAIVISNYVRSHGLQMPFQSRSSGSAHCEWYFAPTTQSARADWPIALMYGSSARIFKMHSARSNHVPKQLCVHMV